MLFTQSRISGDPLRESGAVCLIAVNRAGRPPGEVTPTAGHSPTPQYSQSAQGKGRAGSPGRGVEGRVARPARGWDVTRLRSRDAPPLRGTGGSAIAFVGSGGIAPGGLPDPRDVAVPEPVMTTRLEAARAGDHWTSPPSRSPGIFRSVDTAKGLGASYGPKPIEHGTGCHLDVGT